MHAVRGEGEEGDERREAQLGGEEDVGMQRCGAVLLFGLCGLSILPTFALIVQRKGVGSRWSSWEALPEMEMGFYLCLCMRT